jgi:hypothetical protein
VRSESLAARTDPWRRGRLARSPKRWRYDGAERPSALAAPPYLRPQGPRRRVAVRRRDPHSSSSGPTGHSRPGARSRSASPARRPLPPVGRPGSPRSGGPSPELPAVHADLRVGVRSEDGARRRRIRRPDQCGPVRRCPPRCLRPRTAAARTRSARPCRAERRCRRPRPRRGRAPDSGSRRSARRGSPHRATQQVAPPPQQQELHARASSGAVVRRTADIGGPGPHGRQGRGAGQRPYGPPSRAPGSASAVTARRSAAAPRRPGRRRPRAARRCGRAGRASGGAAAPPRGSPSSSPCVRPADRRPPPGRGPP